MGGGGPPEPCGAPGIIMGNSIYGSNKPELIVCQSLTKLATSVYHNELSTTLQGYFVGTESPVLIIIVFDNYPT